MTRDEFRALLDRAAAGWAGGDAAAVGDCFAEDVEYLDPFLYRFDSARRTCCRSSSRRPAAITSPGTRSSGTTRPRRRPSSTRTRAITATTARPSSGPDRTAGSRCGGSGSISTTRRTGSARVAGPRGGHVAARRPSTTSSSGCRPAARPTPGRSTAGSSACARSEAARSWLAAAAPGSPAGRSPSTWASNRASGPPRRRTPAFVVDDLAAIRERLDGGRMSRSWRTTAALPVARCYVRDPFGNRLELVDAADAGFSAR